MTRAFGRGLVGLGLFLAFVWMLLPIYGSSDGLSLWEVSSRFDVMMFFFLLVGSLLVMAAFFAPSRAELLDGLTTIVAGGAASIIMFFGVEWQWDTPLRVLLAIVIALALVGGSVLLALPSATAERLGTAMSRAGARATPRPQVPPAQPARPAPAPASVTPAGWYPDPSGQHSTRFWDGRTWTERVQ